jgi:hypothetical protein
MKLSTKEKRTVGAITIESRQMISNIESVRQADSAERFHFWLTIALLVIFILLLFYSQKIQGLM